jgi:hypothetical protein
MRRLSCFRSKGSRCDPAYGWVWRMKSTLQTKRTAAAKKVYSVSMSRVGEIDRRHPSGSPSKLRLP